MVNYFLLLTVISVAFGGLTFFASLLKPRSHISSYRNPFYNELLRKAANGNVWKTLRRILGYVDVYNFLYSFGYFVIEIIFIYYLPIYAFILYAAIFPILIVNYQRTSLKRETFDVVDFCLGIGREPTKKDKIALHLYGFVLYSLLWNLSIIIIVAAGPGQPLGDFAAAETVTVLFLIFPMMVSLFAMDALTYSNYEKFLDRIVTGFEVYAEVQNNSTASHENVTKGKIKKLYPHLIIEYVGSRNLDYEAIIRWRDVSNISFALQRLECKN